MQTQTIQAVPETDNESSVIPNRRFSMEEFRDVAEGLQPHFTVFEKFWSLSKPRFSKEVKTAAVYFDKIGECIDFVVNPVFWDSLNFEQKLFVVSHECLHVFFYHGARINLLRGPELHNANLALDVVVNHFIVDCMGFDRAEIDPKNMYCWVDTVFAKASAIPPVGNSFEFYYNLIKEELEKTPGFGQQVDSMSSVDDHDGLESFVTKEFEQAMKEVLDNTDSNDMKAKKKFKQMVEKELKELEKKVDSPTKKAGADAGNSWVNVKTEKVFPKKKWETIVKDWARKYLEAKIDEQWIKPARRFATLSSDLMLPSEDEIDEYEKSRICVWFFLDTSGSCAHLAQRFFNAARTLPEERFDVKLFCFDTQVYPTDLKSGKAYGFGGTSFSCIEDGIQKIVQAKESKYPSTVWVITDGYGDHVRPEFPHRWKWFLSENYKELIPKESDTYMLSDFE